MKKSTFKQVIEEANKIAIFTHITPDADALCSAFGLKNILNNNFDFKDIDVFVDGPIGDLYNPILRNEIIKETPDSDYDLAIVLDCPNLNRIGKYEEVAKNISPLINIDHHETNERFGTHNYVSTKVSSTCELLYLIAKAQEYDLNNLIAKRIYQGIITDTNCFTSSSITQQTHQVVSELLKYKFDANAIKKYYFKNQSITKTQLLTQALISMKFHNDGLLTTMKITNDNLKEAGARFEDTLGIIDSGMNISDTMASAILIEKEPNKIHCSFRSNGTINVGEIAKEFNGGGTLNMAGFQYEGDIKQLEVLVVTALSAKLTEYLKAHPESNPNSNNNEGLEL